MGACRIGLVCLGWASNIDVCQAEDGFLKGHLNCTHSFRPLWMDRKQALVTTNGQLNCLELIELFLVNEIGLNASE